MKAVFVVLMLSLSAGFTGCARPRLGSTSEGKYPSAALPEAEAMLEAERDAVFQGAAGSRNVTGEFTTLFHESGDVLTPERVAALKPYNVLLVHGLLGEVGLGVRRFLDKLDADQDVIGYFKEQEAVFGAHGIDFERVEYHSNAVDRSGGKIVDAVLRSEKPVILFSHSKGCVDTLDALLKLQAMGKLDRVGGWIALQGVFSGAPHAQRYVENGGRRAFGIVAMRLMGGDFDAIRDLTPDARATYHEAHADEIRRLVGALSILCMATWEPPEEGKRPDRTRDAGGQPALTSAFKIQPESSILTGTDYVAKCGINHNVTVIRDAMPYDRPAMTRAFLAMLADRIRSSLPKPSPAVPPVP